MSIARDFDPALGERDRTNDTLIGLLLFLWLTAAVLALTLVGVSFAPNHAGVAAPSYHLDDLLPADPARWSAFVA